MEFHIHFHEAASQQPLTNAVKELSEMIKTLAAARPISNELKLAVASVVAGAAHNDGLIPDEATAKS